MTDLRSVPADPCRLLETWFADAERESGMVNHHTMMLATIDPDGKPSVRAVLRKGFDVATGRLVFFTNYQSRKAQAIEAHPDVAIAMHWDQLERHIRIEGRAERVAAEESDAYFATRPRTHQIGAWASDQSRPMKSWATLVNRALLTSGKFIGRKIERPPHWGGYAVMAESIEFWQSGAGRIHQRLLYIRDEAADSGWRPQWLFP